MPAWSDRTKIRHDTWFGRIGLFLLAGVLLTACAKGPVAPAPDAPSDTAVTNACCVAITPYPKWLIKLLESGSTATGNKVGAVVFRPGHLERYEAAPEYAQRHLRPLDILLSSTKGRLSGQMTPGYFGHVAIYLGTRAQIQQAGLWSLPALVPHQPKINAGHVFLEAINPEVQLATPRAVLSGDAIAIFRPQLSRAQRRAALNFGLSALGKPFDFKFDADSADCLFCVELMVRMMPHLNIPSRQAYDRAVLVPDDVARHGLSSPELQFVGYLYATPAKLATGSRADLIRTLNAAWPEHVP